jgi:hypothetical protein
MKPRSLAIQNKCYFNDVCNTFETQDFERGEIVKISELLSNYMTNFYSNCFAVVEYCMYQRYNIDDTRSYSLVILDDYLKPIDSLAWYDKKYLTSTGGKEKGLKLISFYEEMIGVK